jgi:hypothetical protein
MVQVHSPKNPTRVHTFRTALNLSSVSFSSLLKKEGKGKKKEALWVAAEP